MLHIVRFELRSTQYTDIKNHYIYRIRSISYIQLTLFIRPFKKENCQKNNNETMQNE